MSRKRKKRPRRPRRPLALAKYPVGSQVRARPGRTVPDFSDIPLGGWSGTISEVDHRSDPPTYRIEWDRRTLDGMHPVYRKRCERDGLDHENMWLDESDIEPDTGEPAAIEQPTNLLCRPLSKHDQDDRIRAIFGLTSDDPLPLVNKENLGRYHRHLESHLAFPFQATYRVAIGWGASAAHACRDRTQRAVFDSGNHAGTTGVLCVGMFASTDRSMGRCARTNSYGVNANNCRSERSRTGTQWSQIRTLSARRLTRQAENLLCRWTASKDEYLGPAWRSATGSGRAAGWDSASQEPRSLTPGHS